jgi:membrane protein required for colicin V production
MNPLDVIIVAAMVFFIVRAVFRGFFREVGSLAGIVLGIWLGAVYHPQVTAYLKQYVPAGKMLPLISFALVFALVVVLCNLAGWGLKTVMKKLLFGWADRGLGVGLAILKGILLAYLIIVLLTFYVPSQAPLIAESKLAPLIIRSYDSIIGFKSPASYQDWKRKFLGEANDTPKTDGAAQRKLECHISRHGFRKII